MNYFKDSGEFHEAEPNYSGNCTHVPSQRARILSPRSMLSCDKRLQPETWIPSGLQENVFANPRSTLESLQIPYQGTHPFMTPNAAGKAPALISIGKPVAREDERIGSTIPMPTFARRPPTVSSFVPKVIPQSSTVGQQRQQISELQFDKFPTPSSFSCWKIRFGNQVTTCSDFPSEAMLWIKEVEMVDSMDELKSSRSIAGKNFPNFQNAGRKDWRLLWTKSSKTPTSRRRSVSRNRKPRKRTGFYEEDRSPWWSMTTVVSLVLTITVLDYADLFCITLRDDNVQEFDTRWDEILLSMTKKIHRMMFSKVCTNLGYVSLINSKLYWNCTTWKFISKYRCPNIKNWRRWWKEEKIRNFDCKLFDARHEKIGTVAVVKSLKGLSGVERGKGICYQWKRKRQWSKGDQCSFQHESNDRAKPTPKAEPPSEPQSSKTRGRSVSRKRNARGRSQSEKFNLPPWVRKVLAPNRLVSIGILPSVSSLQRNRDVSSAQSAHSRTGRLKNNQTKSRKRVMT